MTGREFIEVGLMKKAIPWGVTETGTKLHARPYPEASHSLCNEYMHIYGNLLPENVDKKLLCKVCLRILQKEIKDEEDSDFIDEREVSK